MAFQLMNRRAPPSIELQNLRAAEVPDPILDDELKLPKMANLVIVIVGNVLLQISFFSIVSSSNEYALHLGGTSVFSGIVIGIPTVFSGLALIPLGRYDRGGYKIPLHVCCASLICGHILYASAYAADYLYLILIGRIVNGFGFTGFMYNKKFISDSQLVGVRRRTTLATWFVMGQGIGMTLGPFGGGLLYRVGFANRIFNGYTSVGWLMAVIWAIFWICVTLWFEDVPQHLPPTPSTTETTSAPTPVVPLFQPTYSHWGVIVCMCFLSMTCFFILGGWEANLPVFGADSAQFSWSPFAAGNFIALGGITAFPFLLANLFLARRIEDRNILAFGSLLGISGLIIFLALLRTNTVQFGSLFACWWAIALGFNIATTVTFSLLSKQLPGTWNGRLSLAIQYSNYLGRVAGAIWGGSGVHVGMMNYIGLQVAVAGIGASLFTVFWRDLKTKRG